MREKLETLSLSVLREFAKDKKIKGITALRKAELIDAIIAASEKEAEEEKEQAKQEEASQAKQAEAVQSEQGERTEERSESRSAETHTDGRRTRFAGADQNRRENNSRYGEGSNSRYGGNSRYGENSNSRYGENSNSRYGENSNSRYDTRHTSAPRSEESAETVGEETTEERQDARPQRVPEMADGILEVLQDGYGFIRCENFLPGENDVYVSPSQIRKFNLKTGDIIRGPKRPKEKNEKFSALMYLETVNGFDPAAAFRRASFEKMTPVFPNERIHLEKNSNTVAMRMVDLISPIGKGQRGMIVSQPKSGKTTLLKQIANAITKNNPEMHLMILLIDERPEEVTDIKESIVGENVEVIYSTFDELPERHKRVSEMTIERAKRLVEYGQDVIILLDSITRLARAYNLTVTASGRTLSGGLDPAALHMPKRFFGAARNMREGGSLTILATALVETGSKMDDVVFEEFKGTGNMELVLDRKLSEKRVFPAINVAKSSTRRDDLLLDAEEQQAMDIVHKALSGLKTDEAAERILDLFSKTKTNRDFVQTVIKNRYI
jgi:transcription termination factor Rho